MSFIKDTLLPSVIIGLTAIMALVTEQLTRTENVLTALALGAVLGLCVAAMVLSIFLPAIVWHLKVSALERTQ